MENGFLNKITGTVFRDDYIYSPDDSNLWLNLFVEADKIDPNLSSVLMYIRNTGAKLIPNREYGYIIRPVIGSHGFHSQAEYDKEKKYLNKHRDKVVKLLRKIGDKTI